MRQGLAGRHILQHAVPDAVPIVVELDAQLHGNPALLAVGAHNHKVATQHGCASFCDLLPLPDHDAVIGADACDQGHEQAVGILP